MGYFLLLLLSSLSSSFVLLLLSASDWGDQCSWWDVKYLKSQNSSVWRSLYCCETKTCKRIQFNYNVIAMDWKQASLELMGDVWCMVVIL